MNCIITGNETTLKWKNYPIDREMMDICKEFKKRILDTL